MTVHVKARLLLVSAAVLFSTGGAAIKWTTLTAWQVAGMRSLIAAIALLIFLPDARRHWSRRNWLVGVVYAIEVATEKSLIVPVDTLQRLLENDEGVETVQGC